MEWRIGESVALVISEMEAPARNSPLVGIDTTHPPVVQFPCPELYGGSSPCGRGWRDGNIDRVFCGVLRWR
jgi:hypothetical protein